MVGLKLIHVDKMDPSSVSSVDFINWTNPSCIVVVATIFEKFEYAVLNDMDPKEADNYWVHT